jgi:glutaredoxin
MSDTITVYSAPTCPDCRALKAWLGRNGIDYAERDLADEAVMNEAKRRFGVRVAPITEIGEWFTYGTFEDQRPRIESRLREAGTWPI